VPTQKRTELPPHKFRVAAQFVAGFGRARLIRLYWASVAAFARAVAPCLNRAPGISGYSHGTSFVDILIQDPASVERGNRQTTATKTHSGSLSGFQLAVHGHQHIPAVAKVCRGVRTDTSLEIEGLTRDLVALSAGSAGAKPERLGAYMRDNSFNLIRVDQKHLEIEARRYTPGAMPSRLFHTTLATQ